MLLVRAHDSRDEQVTFVHKLSAAAASGGSGGERIAVAEAAALEAAPEPAHARLRRVVPLQRPPDGQRVALSGIALLGGAHLRLDAEHVLDVVPDLVSDDVRLRELAWRTVAPRELPIEPEVDVDLLVGRTVEGAHR